MSPKTGTDRPMAETGGNAQKTYAMKFLCLNCGHTFTEDIPYGKRVVEQAFSGKCWIGGDRGSTLVVCPVCGVSEVKKDIAFWK